MRRTKRIDANRAFSRRMPFIFLVLGGVLTVVAATTALSQKESASGTADKARVARGEYLVTIVGCNDCHTPWKLGPKGPEPDMSRMLSGHPESAVVDKPPVISPGPWMAATNWTLTAWAGPWGITYTTNLTPDTNTGMGIWTEEMFMNAMRLGKHMGTSRPIMPPMPWNWIGKMTDEDLKAVYAYLRSIPPIHNRVPEYAPPPAPPGSAPQH